MNVPALPYKQGVGGSKPPSPTMRVTPLALVDSPLGPAAFWGCSRQREALVRAAGRISRQFVYAESLVVSTGQAWAPALPRRSRIGRPWCSLWPGGDLEGDRQR